MPNILSASLSGTALAESSSRRHTMSGILKRKLEEGPAPYLSLHGSEDDDVSCSDSGNSSDSLNHPVPSGLLDCKVAFPHISREREGERDVEKALISS